MTEQEFLNGMTRLVSQFGKAAYSDERSRLIAREVKDMDAHWWVRTVDRMLGECRQAPLLPEIREHVSKERERVWGQTKKTNVVPLTPRFGCGYCSDTGVYLCHKQGEPGTWAFRCHCDRGCKDPRTQIPQFTQSHADDGFTFAEIRPGGAQRQEARP